MDNRDQIPELESIVPEAHEERGAGGKLRKPPSRKPPASPYARPPANDRRRWISKLVDPAYRLIAGGATRFLPSFLSTSASASALPKPPSHTADQGKPRTDELYKKDDPARSDVHLLASELPELESTGDINHKFNNSFDFVLPRQDEKEEQPEKNMLSAIERLVKGKKFTREEFHHLVEVLNSREINVSNGEQEQDHTNSTTRQDNEGIALAHRLPKVSNERRHEESKGAKWGSTTPLCLPKDKKLLREYLHIGQELQCVVPMASSKLSHERRDKASCVLYEHRDLDCVTVLKFSCYIVDMVDAETEILSSLRSVWIHKMLLL